MRTLVVDYASEDGGGPPHVEAAVAAGVRVAIIRRSVVYFDTKASAWRLATDPTFERDAPLWRAAGVVVGSYGAWAFHTGAPAIADQVGVFRAAPGEILRGIDLPPASDIEFNGTGVPATGRTQAQCFELVKEVDAALTAAYGCRPMTYTSHVQWCDDNGLGGPEWPEGGNSPLWLKTPYRLGPGQPLDGVLPPAPHLQHLDWDKNDYWRYPPPWSGHWLQQWQGDCAGFPGFDHKVDVGEFNNWDTNVVNSNYREAWVRARLKAPGTIGVRGEVAKLIKVFQANNKLAADGVIGPKTFAALAWQ